MDKIERNHPIKMIYDLGNFINGFVGIIVAIGFLINKIGFIKSIFIGIVLLSAVILFELLLWRKNIFIIRHDSIYHEKGVFNIQKIEIPFERINTVDVSQRLLERIFKAATIKIDTGNITNKGSELKITLKKDRAEKIRYTLLSIEGDNGYTNIKQKNKYYIVKSKQLIVYSLISNSVFKGIGILFVLQQFFDQYLKSFINIDISQYINKLQRESMYHMIYIIASIILGLVFISVCLSVIYDFVKYYGFKMWSDMDKIYVKYGAINKKNYSFDKDKVKGIHITQTILMQLFGFFTMEIESIGYGDEKGEKAILYPVCSRSLKDEIVENLLGKFKYSGEIARPQKSAAFRFFYKKVIFWAVTAVICFFIKPEFVMLTLILLLFMLIMGYLEFKNTAFGMDKDLVYMCYHSFNKTKSILKMKAVQSVTLSCSYFQHRKGFCDYSIILYSSNAGRILKVRNLKDNIVDEKFI